METNIKDFIKKQKEELEKLTFEELKGKAANYIDANFEELSTREVGSKEWTLEEVANQLAFFLALDSKKELHKEEESDDLMKFQMVMKLQKSILMKMQEEGKKVVNVEDIKRWGLVPNLTK